MVVTECDALWDTFWTDRPRARSTHLCRHGSLASHMAVPSIFVAHFGTAPGPGDQGDGPSCPGCIPSRVTLESGDGLVNGGEEMVPAEMLEESAVFQVVVDQE